MGYKRVFFLLPLLSVLLSTPFPAQAMPPTQQPTVSPTASTSQNNDTTPSTAEQPSTSPDDQLDCSNATSVFDIIRCADFTIPKLNCSNPISDIDVIRCANITFPGLNCSNPTSNLDILLCANFTIPGLNCSNATSKLDILRCANFTFPGLNCSNATSELDILRCANVTFPGRNVPCFRCLRGLTVAGVFDELHSAFRGRNESLRGIHKVVNNLRDVIGHLLHNGSLEPDELQTAGYTLGRSIRYFRNQRYLNRDALDSIVDTFNDILDSSNEDSWNNLTDGSAHDSEQMLQYVEDCGLYMGSFLNRSTRSVLISKPNIVFRAKLFSDGEETDSMFPEADDLINSTVKAENSTGINARINIPASLIRVITSQGGDAQVVSILMNNIQDFLPTNSFNRSKPASLIISSQVVDSNSTSISFSDVLKTTPVELQFNLSQKASRKISRREGRPLCVSWEFNTNSSMPGRWVSDGLTTVEVDSNIVTCESTHLTSFCVLVDVTGSESSNLALSIVSYIGCAVSLLCLLVTVIFLLTLGKALFTEVHNFIHLNLALALFLGLIVFVAGIETAASNEIACKAVAFMLHYFFLAAFCWMLCEGIMLYLMLVVVFSKLIKKWWLYLLLGWGLPVIPPAVTLGVQFDNYTTTQNFCWLGAEGGTIWAFIGPMLLIIALNLVIMIIIIVKLARVRWQRSAHKKKLNQNAGLVGDLIQGVIVLLPLLGLTWVFGLLAVDENTVVFAWLFTVFNSLQGLFIFSFHVLKSKRVWGRIKMWYRKKRALTTVTRTSTAKESSSMYSVTKGSRAPDQQGNSIADVQTSELGVIPEQPEVENNGKE